VIDNLPIYRFVVGENDEAQLDAIAFVDEPAIEMNWQAFNAQVNIIVCKECGHSWDIADGGEYPYMCKCGIDNTPKEIEANSFLKFKADTEKRIISGPLMVADLPIYRKDKGGDYYGVFKAEDIYNLRNKFFKQGKANLVNEMHNSDKMIDGVYMIESFIIDSKRGINAPKGYQLTDGSWFGSYKVDNDEIWNDFIKTGEFKGFSVEGIFNAVQIDSKPLNIIEQIIEIIKNTNE
jgi:hypothetical protein